MAQAEIPVHEISQKVLNLQYDNSTSILGIPARRVG